MNLRCSEDLGNIRTDCFSNTWIHYIIILPKITAYFVSLYEWRKSRQYKAAYMRHYTMRSIKNLVLLLNFVVRTLENCPKRRKYKKRTLLMERSLNIHVYRSSSFNLAWTQASWASVDMTRSTLDDSLNTLYVRLPCSVGTSVWVRNLDTKGYALSADITFCH